MKIDPYLFFEGRCEEAMAFYQQALGARVEFMMRYSESPEPPPPGMLPPGSEHKIMHASLHIGGALVMMSDGMCSGSPSFKGFSLSLDCPEADAAREAFAALAGGGHVRMPLAKTFWAPLFGMVEDRFGVSWMVGVSDDAK
ncbi:VOC family protein [Roseateles sp.]|uniref:VOC family protein n=1 Tax=Roseateles sp. TaxID=1971397 RepID=UPI0025CCFDF5|nr:glyoxalase/bleomycin resistance/extradiol dioxygenase family protein [Roseateles sp.]MBV8036517.1 glyoxalase/bleomycin resistance/extradiol dioxygenase family protein [Roseateles sp.]